MHHIRTVLTIQIHLIMAVPTIKIHNIRTLQAIKMHHTYIHIVHTIQMHHIKDSPYNSKAASRDLSLLTLFGSTYFV